MTSRKAKKSPGPKIPKNAERPYPIKTLIIGFTVLLGFSACQSFTSQEEVPEPAPQATTPVLIPTTYPIPSEGVKNKLGETKSEAEQRYLQYAHQKTATGETDEQLVNAGYTLCGYYKESKSRPELFAKIEEASGGEPGKRMHLINLSSYAAETLCPEFSAFE